MSRPCVFECSDGQERVLKFRKRATRQALASDWIGALLATVLGIRTPAPALVEIDEEAISTMRQEAESDARPGYAFGTAFLPAAENVVGVRGITACSNHAELLGRLAVLDTWIGTQDRQRPDGAWNLLAELDDGPRPQLVAIDFGMAFTDSLFPLLGTHDQSTTKLVWPGEVRPLADLQAVSETVAQVEYMTEADIIKQVETAPRAWLSAEERGRMIGSLFAGRQEIASAMKELEGKRD